MIEQVRKAHSQDIGPTNQQERPLAAATAPALDIGVDSGPDAPHKISLGGITRHSSAPSETEVLETGLHFDGQPILSVRAVHLREGGSLEISQTAPEVAPTELQPGGDSRGTVLIIRKAA